MKHPRLLAIATLALFAMPFVACSEKDDPDDMTIAVNTINASNDGTIHYQSGASWSEAGVTRLFGASPSTFSVSDEVKVHFSPGNLQYNTTNGKWQFASRQYLTAETDPTAADGVIDLFGWGTSGWESGAIAIEPQSTDMADTNYWVDGNSQASLYGDYANADWAAYNPIAGGGNKAHLWRVLRTSEWQYLFGNNPKRRGRWGMATLEGGYVGVILIPDEWEAPAGISFTAGADGWATNEYTAVQWFRLEQSGVVFLPASGYREGAVASSVGQTGNYWAADAADATCACDLFFRARSLDATDRDARHYGFSVRPVLE